MKKLIRILKEGPQTFRQWDENQRLEVLDSRCTQVHFANANTRLALVCPVLEEAGIRVVDVPNILLQEALELTAHLVLTQPEGRTTFQTEHFQVLPRQQPQDYVYTPTQVQNYETLAQRITQLEQSGDTGGADWNAAEGEPGYVKNRTHWAAGGIVEVLANCEWTWNEEMEGFATPSVPSLEIGKPYIVNYNGTEYTCAAQDASAIGGDVALGDLGLMTGGASTGEPFVFAPISDQGASLLIPIDGATSVTLSIYYNGEVVHKLEPKFLPDGVPYVEKGDMVELPVAYEWPDGDGALITAPIGLKVGKTYVVVWDGVEYVVTAKEEDIEGIPCVALGNTTGETTEAFMLAELPAEVAIEMGFYGIAMDVTGGAYVDFSIHGEGEVVHKLDPKCLPDGFGGGGLYTVVARMNLETQDEPTADQTYEEAVAQAVNPDIQVRVLLLGSYGDMIVQCLYANLVNYNAAAGVLTFIAPHNEYTFFQVEMKSDGSVSFDTKQYKYNNT